MGTRSTISSSRCTTNRSSTRTERSSKIGLDCILVYPRPSADSPNRNVALGIVFTGAAMERRGWEVAYFDARFDPESLLRSYLLEEPTLIGFSVMTGIQSAETQRLLTMCRSLSPRSRTVLGGVHPSLFPALTLEEPEVDFVVVGEGEVTCSELIEAIASGSRRFEDVPGLGWKDGEMPVVNRSRPFLDPEKIELPLTPNTRRLFEQAARTRHLSYQTTRGCPFRCAFCYNLAFNHRLWRRLPVERVAKDLVRLAREVEFDHVYFVDDYIGRDKGRIGELGEAMRRFGLTWHSSIRASDIDGEMARALEEGGCERLLFGIESASERMMNQVLTKDVKGGRDAVVECVEHMARTSITPLYSFMYNVPGERAEDRESTFRLADWIYRIDTKAQIGFYAYTPYPGTPLYNQALERGFTPPKRLAEWGAMGLSNGLSPELRDLYFIAGLRFRGRRGDRTDENFPGWRRLSILPFEFTSRARWHRRSFRYSPLERWAVHRLIQWASARER